MTDRWLYRISFLVVGMGLGMGLCCLASLAMYLAQGGAK